VILAATGERVETELTLDREVLSELERVPVVA
jgi:hypothetical protein